MHLWLLLLALGTFVFFPHLAKGLVGLALVGLRVGGLAFAGIILHEEFIAKPSREAKLAAECQPWRRFQATATHTPEEILAIIDAPSWQVCQHLAAPPAPRH